MCFAFRALNDYEQWVIDVAGPFAMLVRGLPQDQREVLRARLIEAFAPFAHRRWVRASGRRSLRGRELNAASDACTVSA